MHIMRRTCQQQGDGSVQKRAALLDTSVFSMMRCQTDIAHTWRCAWQPVPSMSTCDMRCHPSLSFPFQHTHTCD
eukprot:826759-Alexandrium_andersonii.AAC.2